MYVIFLGTVLLYIAHLVGAWAHLNRLLVDSGMWMETPSLWRHNHRWLSPILGLFTLGLTFLAAHLIATYASHGRYNWVYFASVISTFIFRIIATQMRVNREVAKNPYLLSAILRLRR